MKYDAVVIGDGIAAHAAAAMVARRGFSCLLLRDPDKTGGRSAIIRKEGFIFDFGVLGNRLAGAHPEIVLKAAGIPVRFHPGGRPIYFNGTKLIGFPDSPAKAAASSMLGLAGKAAWARINSGLKQQLLDPYAFKKPVADWLLKIPGADQDVSEFASLVSGWMFDATDLARISLGTFAEGLRGGAGRGPVTPLGGWDHIFSALDAAIREKGDVIGGARVESIVFDGDAARGVKAGGEFIEADFIIAAVPVRRLLEIAHEQSFSEDWIRRLKKLEPLCGISLYLGLGKPVANARGPVLTGDPFTRGLAPTNLEPALAPRGCQILSWFMPATVETLRDAEALKTARLKLKKITEMIFPGIGDHIILEEWRENEAVWSAAPVLGQTREELPPVQVFKAANAAMVNDAAGIAGPKGDAEARAALEAVSIAERQLKSRGRTH